MHRNESAPSVEKQSEETLAIETGAVELSECPRAGTWNQRKRPEDHYAINHPSSWELVEEADGLLLKHPKGWLSAQVSVQDSDEPKKAVVEHRSTTFAGWTYSLPSMT